MPHYCYGSDLQHSETDRFGTRVIAYQHPNSYPGALHWPHYSPDLNPCHFFPWGHMKDLTYKKKPTDLTQRAILVCSKLALQICKLAASLTRQDCKCETSLQQVNTSFEVTMGRTCSKLALQTHCKL
ncbi:hypothetical protein AVEN_30559-1 [Araneus ventricosus]|uniref:Tc1-like transposase DDE domain-containing protein n=1 Tax=Araneus ventricosus TaxID=182803 RepID=A0A4Y2H6R5_ARAVE|nr:hypothetical protein AVEN_30559-1 [Araneus ventricosus]